MKRFAMFVLTYMNDLISQFYQTVLEPLETKVLIFYMYARAYPKEMIKKTRNIIYKMRNDYVLLNF